MFQEREEAKVLLAVDDHAVPIGEQSAAGRPSATVQLLMAYLSREAVLLYFFLAAVADKHGVSFYGDVTLATLLRMTLPALIQARDELLARDLIAHETRWTQVLSVPSPDERRRCEPGGGLMRLGEVMRRATALPHPNEERSLP